MSGEVACWLLAGGTLVGVSEFRVMWFEFAKKSLMRLPLWSL